MYLECTVPPPSDRTTSALAPEFLVTYAIMALELVLLVVHHIYKRNAEGGFRSRSPLIAQSTLPRGAGAAFKGPGDVELSDMGGAAAAAAMRDAGLSFRGYRFDPFGAAAAYTVMGTSILWVLLLAVLVLDYYAVFAKFGFREESDMIFYDHSLLSKVFILAWHFVTGWFLWVKLAQAGADSRFGRRTHLSSASFVVVEKRPQEPVALANQGALVDWVRRAETRLRRWTGADVALFTVPVQQTSTGRRYIEFECARYVFDDRHGTFVPFAVAVGPTFGDLAKQKIGLASHEAANRTELVGPNTISFPQDSFYSALFKEFSGLFYIYQMMMLWIWYYYAYYYMGLVLTAVIVISGIVKVYVFLGAQKRVLSMAKFHGSARVLRNGTWSLETSEALVPGDVIQVVPSTEHAISVDAVLVDGGAVCDESSLTGEALPVVKAAVRTDTPETVFNSATHKTNMLFAGCHVLEAQAAGRDRPVLAIVTATGTQTSKGRLVKDILFPTPVSFVFIEHLKIVFPILIVWGVIMLAVSIAMLGTSGADAWFYGMFTISQVLSPLLPAVLVIGQSVASERLIKRGIMCVDLDRITLCGKAKVFCFDKTGTLTREGLDFLGVQPVLEAGGGGPPTFASVQQSFESFPQRVRAAMLTCHSVAPLGQTLAGNFVDVEMFRATGASLALQGEDYGVSSSSSVTVVTPRSQGDRRLEIVKRFEFVHGSAHSRWRSQVEAGARLFGLCLFLNELKDDVGEAFGDMRGTSAAPRPAPPVLLVGDLDGVVVSASQAAWCGGGRRGTR
ncbi:hypothetical protein HK405_004904 [Cladochytrium tenue]|nr:hypothetical protein HK405_004904 [Cladochytrium tenue]